MSKGRHEPDQAERVQTGAVQVDRLQILVMSDHVANALHHKQGHLVDFQVVQILLIDQVQHSVVDRLRAELIGRSVLRIAQSLIALVE